MGVVIAGAMSFGFHVPAWVLGVDIRGGYGNYTGRSCDEYIELITIARVPS